MWRAGFGPAAMQLQQTDTISPQQLFNTLQKLSSKPPKLLDATDDYLKGLMQGIGEEGMRRRALEESERKKMQQQSRQSIRNLNLMWLKEMVTSDAQLREKLAFFWHGHFASRNLNVFFQQQLLQILRTHALGNFRDLLHEVSKSAAILNFLNANQNRKDHPNENFAREVMELFTLGRGHYTEQDVREAARAFTGWGASLKGDFVFRRFQHDNTSKVVLGKSGHFDGDDVLDILLEQKQTARFITEKMYRFFVNENRIDKDKIDWLSSRFYQSGYQIAGLVQDIFTADWFYDHSNIGSRIKSPVELIAGIQRMMPMNIANGETLLLLQRLLGQVLFYPPNVAGWPFGKSWIDSSSLMLRLRLPQMLTAEDELNIQAKTDDDQMMGRNDVMTVNMGRLTRPINADINWSVYTTQFDKVNRAQLLDAIAGGLLQVKSRVPQELLLQNMDSSNREQFIRSATIRIMSTPEYQLC